MTFTNYLERLGSDNFEILKKYSIRKKVIEINGIQLNVLDLKDRSYKLVKMELPEKIITNDFYGLIVSVYKDFEIDITIDDIDNSNYKELIYFILYVLDSIAEISELEKSLSTPTDIDMEKAGINEFQKFGIINIVDSLAKGDILKWNEVVKLSYTDVFNKLLKNKTEAEFNKKYQEILIDKNKKNKKT